MFESGKEHEEVRALGHAYRLVHDRLIIAYQSGRSEAAIRGFVFREMA